MPFAFPSESVFVFAGIRSEPGSAGGSRLPWDAIEAALGLFGKTNRQIALILIQDVDSEIVTRPEVRQRGDGVVDRYQN